MKKKYFGWMIFILLLLSACTATPEATTTSETPSTITTTSQAVVYVIDDENPKTISNIITTETISQDNCDGLGDVANRIERTVEIAHTLELGGEVSVTADGQIGFAGTDVGVGVTVAEHLNYTYGRVKTLTEDITVKAPPGTYMEHTINIEETWSVGDVSVIVGDIQETFPFQFRTGFSLALGGSRNLGCDGEQATPSSPISTLTSPTASPINPTSTASIREPWISCNEFVRVEDQNFVWIVESTDAGVCSVNLDEGEFIVGTADRFGDTIYNPPEGTPCAAFAIIGPYIGSIQFNHSGGGDYRIGSYDADLHLAPKQSELDAHPTCNFDNRTYQTIECRQDGCSIR